MEQVVGIWIEFEKMVYTSEKNILNWAQKARNNIGGGSTVVGWDDERAAVG